jgi:hypothetical protein
MVCLRAIPSLSYLIPPPPSLLGEPGASTAATTFYGVPPATGPPFATAFLRGLSSRPTSVAATDSALAAALERAKTEATAAEEPVRVAALAWEHERTTADAFARRVAEAERFLHAFTGEHVASQQPPPTAPLQLGDSPGGTDDPMVAYLHLQAAAVPHIKNLVTIVLNSTSTSYARWRDQILLVLRRYALDGHVLSDTPARAHDPAWRRHDIIVMSWISRTISLDLQDIVQTPDPTARVMCRSLEIQFLRNAQTRALHLDAELRTLEQGDLSVGEYCRKMKNTTDGLRDLGFTVPEHILVLNVLRGLPSSYEAVRTLLTQQQPPPWSVMPSPWRSSPAATTHCLDHIFVPYLSRTCRCPTTVLRLAVCLSPWCSSPRAERRFRGGGRRERGGGGRGTATEAPTPLSLLFPEVRPDRPSTRGQGLSPCGPT